MNGIEIRANATAKEATLYMYGDVQEWGKASVQNVLRTLAELEAGTTLHVRIHSYGGEVHEGNAILNALHNHSGKVHTHVDGIAASMASVIFQAGATRTMAENAMLMVHNPWILTWGNAKELRKTAEVLDKVTDNLLATYAKRSGKAVDELRVLLDDETWLTAQEAVDLKLADDISESVMKGDPKAAMALKGAPRNKLLAAYEPSQTDNSPATPTPINMDLKALAQTLGLPEHATAQQIQAKAAELKAERERLAAEAQAAQQAAQNARITALVAAAIQDKKIVPAAKAHWEKLAQDNFDSTKAILDSMPKVTSLTGHVKEEGEQTTEGENEAMMKRLREQYPVSAHDAMIRIPKTNSSK
jgi:ATP-dependent protease ClpP protease subunit